ncbi:hypothetical protein JTE90_004397 [Oedothorax gibbosus]|uniref:Protein-lysine N-methyltransferase JTE90_004397 n=1 Tax=Oedothorax gibbosus TaxID=931172 RepID=A0AAV6UQJ6_9ARAC|nr:hypothetical protein JTE90_004397 [Oedothorax gibbosus]
MEDDEDIVLSEHARLALQAFLDEKSAALNSCDDNFVEEDWELSQFWYNTETSVTLARSALECVGETGRIACVSCPSIYNQLRQFTSESSENYLFEYDKRFQDKFPDRAIFYDYKNPLSIDDKFKAYFDIVFADPPFLSTECIEKFVETIHFLTHKKIVICTGEVMEESVKELLDLKTCDFVPQHERKLGNEFRCYANFDFDQCIAKIKSTSDVNG